MTDDQAETVRERAQGDDEQNIEQRADVATAPRGSTEAERAEGDVGGRGEEPALFESSERDALSGRWTEIQTTFVDDPRRAVEQANDLVSDLMDRLVAGFKDEQSQLESRWDRGDDVSTEDLRVVLQRYRSFFGRLLEV
jgi:hypothetical protein